MHSTLLPYLLFHISGASIVLSVLHYFLTLLLGLLKLSYLFFLQVETLRCLSFIVCDLIPAWHSQIQQVISFFQSDLYPVT